MTNCPECGSALETFLRIDLNDVEVGEDEHGRPVVTAFTLAGSANDPSNGIVVEEATVTCVDHGHELEAYVPYEVTNRWSYRDE